MKIIMGLAIFLIISCSRRSDRESSMQIGGRCEDCEIMLVDMPNNINWQSVISPSGEPGEKLIIKGVIYKIDGITPAPETVMYLYQTNSEGYYAAGANQNPSSRRHGRIRGWIKTNNSGEYEFTTIKPGIYPDRTLPAHIHPIIKEQGKSFYYIDDYVFEGEFKVDDNYKSRQEKRCGSGIISITKDSSGIWRGTRDLILGLNIPNYN